MCCMHAPFKVCVMFFSCTRSDDQLFKDVQTCHTSLTWSPVRHLRYVCLLKHILSPVKADVIRSQERSERSPMKEYWMFRATQKKTRKLIWVSTTDPLSLDYSSLLALHVLGRHRSLTQGISHHFLWVRLKQSVSGDSARCFKHKMMCNCAEHRTQTQDTKSSGFELISLSDHRRKKSSKEGERRGKWGKEERQEIRNMVSVFN